MKLIMSWDITPEHEQDYFEFVIRDYIPGVQRMGCELTDAWATVYGNKPQITVSVIIGSPRKARQLLFSEDWLSLNNRLQDFIQNYTMKLVYARNRFQL
ncbi:MAG TPA: hypothetical protein PKZ26_03525 [Anaerolineaceae bacterium]|nr:hypothetical protein [Chloroflexota bacterium]HNS06962.1 hypothetical protein [Anaerolineaceae bacterium]HNW13312.1 hypothetical protein [Anaerolineaceae bacterium]HOE03471.1 hypothetical protein [Anaerolineaceae bacterium]HOQ69133.1 hypothetical protein [Anaerolineaceae bacterium]